MPSIANFRRMQVRDFPPGSHRYMMRQSAVSRTRQSDIKQMAKEKRDTEFARQ